MRFMSSPRIFFAASILPLALAVNLGAQSPLTYPAAQRGSQVDDYHGTKIADPYRWLEDTDSPETKAWVEAENKLTFGYLAGDSGAQLRFSIDSRRSWNYPEVFGPPDKADGGKLFFSENSGLLNQSILYLQRRHTSRFAHAARSRTHFPQMAQSLCQTQEAFAECEAARVFSRRRVDPTGRRSASPQRREHARFRPHAQVGEVLRNLLDEGRARDSSTRVTSRRRRATSSPNVNPQSARLLSQGRNEAISADLI